MHLLQQIILTAPTTFIAQKYVESAADGDRRPVEINLHRFDICVSGTQIDGTITVTCFCHNGCCLPYPQISDEFIFQQDKAPAYRTCSFSDVNILQGSVATRLMYAKPLSGVG